MKKLDELYSGKVKTVYTTDNPDHLILHFRDDISAFNAEKTAQLSAKGKVNNYFNAFMMEQLHAAGITTHHEKVLNDNESLVKNLKMMPVECVVRNFAAGSLCKRLGIEKGREFSSPIFEFFYKSDELGDPLINENHILTFGWANEADIAEMKRLSFEVNEIYKQLFSEAGLILVDYKLEFGHFHGDVILGDEFTPDSCRIWDKDTKESFDKDRFRQDMGGVIEAYETVAKRLGIEIPESTT